MRKYFNPRVTKKFAHTLPNRVSEWKLLEMYVRANCSRLTFEDYTLLAKAIDERCPHWLRRAQNQLDSSMLLHELYLDSTENFSVNRQCCAMLKKFPMNAPDLDPTATAFNKWKLAEDQCRETNNRLRSLEVLPPVLDKARLLIRDLLGDEVTRDDLIVILGKGTHGPGATLSSVGNRTTPYYKFMDFPYTCTRSAYPYARAAIAGDPHWYELIKANTVLRTIPDVGHSDYQRFLQTVSSVVDFAESDKITFVPKDTFTDRPIAVGASLNMFLQLGVKHLLTARLQRVGINLMKQDKNRHFAYLASKHWQIDGRDNPSQFSTIDLASASDTISTELVRRLLPPEWFALLDDIRHKSGLTPDGQEVLYEKFSAMGNGFTFPLESLIFWAVTKAAAMEEGRHYGPDDITVFGDDIICRKTVVYAVIEALEIAGFSINLEKTFISGPFKESCGHDYFRGTNVRPIYIKRDLKDLRDIYGLANRISILARHRFNRGLQLIYCYLFESVPEKQRNLVSMVGSQEEGFQVPLAYARRHVPLYANAEELGIIGLDPNNDQLHPVERILTITAKPYKGRAFACYYLALRNSDQPVQPEFFRNPTELAVMTGSTGVMVTRRKAVRTYHSYRAVLNWDGTESNALHGHLVWTMG